jgi:hypothetical protein
VSVFGASRNLAPAERAMIRCRVSRTMVNRRLAARGLR